VRLLLINPWIYDFAAYNYWAEPLGLHYTASFLEHCGAEIDFIDCLTSDENPNPGLKPDGRSKFHRKVINPPSCLDFVVRRGERTYARYGINEEEFISKLLERERPDAVLVTSIMTYWYPGAFRVIELVRARLPKVPVVLGGIYARLCTRHATGSDADYIFTDTDLSTLPEIIEKLTGKKLPVKANSWNLGNAPFPFRRRERRFFAILTRTGCPYSCTYCACGYLWPGGFARETASVVEEAVDAARLTGIHNIAFYDDALLIDADRHIIPIVEELHARMPDLAFHLPNGIHAGLVTQRIATLFHTAGVKSIRIGLETADDILQINTGGKTTSGAYRHAVDLLRKAGYRRENIGTYALAGLPGQKPEDVEKTIDLIYEAGGAPLLAYFSPIPHTPLWKTAARSSPLPIEREPLLHNNTVYIRGNPDYGEQAIHALRDRAAELRKQD